MNFVTGQFNDSFPPIMDGVGNTVYNYAYWLNKMERKTYVVTPKFPDHVDDLSFPVIRYSSAKLPMRPPYRLGLPALDQELRKKLSQIDFDLVHAHCPFSSGQVALKIARERKIPVVATFHSKFYDDFKTNLKLESLTQMAVKRIVHFFESVDYVWAVNEGTAGTLKSYGYQGPIEVMQNGTDFESDINIKDAKTRINEMYGINTDDRVLLFVGQQIFEKNIEMLLRSLRELKNLGLPYKALIVGEGYAQKDFITLAKELKIEDKVTFTGAIKDRDLLKCVYARADLFLFPSIYDNAPIVTREAAALNAPSLLIAGSNAAEGIEHNVNGFLSENNYMVYAKSIETIFNNPKRLDEVAKQAQETVAISWETVLKRVERRYEQIIYAQGRKNII